MPKPRDLEFGLYCALWSFVGMIFAKNLQETALSTVADFHAAYAAGYYCGAAFGSFLGVTNRKIGYMHCVAPVFALCTYTVVPPTAHFLPVFTVAALSAVIFEQFNSRHERQR